MNRREPIWHERTQMTEVCIARALFLSSAEICCAGSLVCLTPMNRPWMIGCIPSPVAPCRLHLCHSSLKLLLYYSAVAYLWRAESSASARKNRAVEVDMPHPGIISACRRSLFSDGRSYVTVPEWTNSSLVVFKNSACCSTVVSCRVHMHARELRAYLFLEKRLS